MKKKVLAVVLGMSMVVAMMTGCGASKETSDSANSAEKTYTIGISQFAEHGSLDNCREGFIEGLKEEGLEEGKNLKRTVAHATVPFSIYTLVLGNAALVPVSSRSFISSRLIRSLLFMYLS